MIFESIQLTNLFSYYGNQEIQLGSPEPGRNVCLIMGRNGFGKTSLLNSLKLLFTGVSYEPLRRAVQRTRMPTVKQYVEGAGNDWWGIMNRRARNEGQTRCAIRVVWSEDIGRVTIERSWRIENGAWDNEESLTVATATETFKDDEAQEFLDRRLPQDYVYFFLFDGEQIQELAESKRDSQQRQMERLLGIGAIDALRGSLNQAIGRWERDELEPQARADLERLEGDIRGTEADLDLLDRTQASLDQEIENDTDALRRNRRRIEGLSAFVHRHDEAQLKDDRARIQAQRIDSLDRLSAQLPRDVVLLTNPSLVTRALERLDQVLGSDANARSRVLDVLLDTLPARLFDQPAFPDPDMRDSQRAYYRYKLMRILEQEAEATGDTLDPTFAPDPQAATVARDQLAPYVQADALRSARTEELRRLQGFAAELRQLETDLLNVGSLSEEERARYDRYVVERDQLEQHLDAKKKRQTELEGESNGLKRKLDDARRRADQIRAKLGQNVIIEDRIATARRLGHLFGALKDSRKQERRGELEAAINRHFRVLMSSHHLIDRVEVDEDFGLRYLDQEGNPIGMGNLAAGMKQLMATALLWALSEASGKQVPVVIDTPLARIDLAHQEGILQHYYPNAAAQVIVLPTDSELDARKLKLIAGHVYRAYRLTNPDGEHTIPEPVALADLMQGG
ncbi:DNA sulfur modification protein DndD [Thiocystis violascens]|uniref:DNA sulfur modification protein DndD n=1 Tax=Thiocystis violascens (strain ATCC 17096 / DSM 198 / 6111) TaxID=765911 RepID=I3YBP6_THIV6|nr:DNA sulfur modification protein DndD [Thiocystis violascens]AFL74414.1 DNA sulfur modification protein DndD [Thiocystis violascens DSM 198]